MSRAPKKPAITEAQIAARIAKIPYAKVLGVRPLLMGRELTLVLPYSDAIIGNPILPALHGGAVSAFMEMTAILQIAMETGAPKFAKPISVSMDYLRRGHPKDTFARAIITRQGSRVANVRVQAWQDSFDTPITILHGHFMLARDG